MMFRDDSQKHKGFVPNDRVTRDYLLGKISPTEYIAAMERDVARLEAAYGVSKPRRYRRLSGWRLARKPR
jgi:hypothetical protein